MTIDRFILSVSPAFLILCILFLKRGDVFNRNGGWLILKLILGGLVTMRLALWANSYLSMLNTKVDFNTFDSIVVIFAGAFNEEMAKLIPLLFLFYLSKRFQSKKDVFFCVICIGAFFAAFENIYMEDYNKLIGNLIMRSFTAVPAHLSFACLMAPFLYFAVKDKDYSMKHYSTGGIFFGVQLSITFMFVYWFMNRTVASETLWYSFLKYSCFIYFIVLLIELIVFLINPLKFKKLLKFNYKLGMLMIGVLLPSFLHTLHNWSASRFDGWHLFVTYLSLFSTYILILTYTSFTIESDQPEMKFGNKYTEPNKNESAPKESTWEKQSL
ncbi:MAG: hypothetical protein COA79_00680 [Planctomycetota bacterium]|nr:MAG: hypothetical protein COA79_00680 [Planctomycetota bacterium]